MNIQTKTHNQTVYLGQGRYGEVITAGEALERLGLPQGMLPESSRTQSRVAWPHGGPALFACSSMGPGRTVRSDAFYGSSVLLLSLACVREVRGLLEKSSVCLRIVINEDRSLEAIFSN